MSASRLCMALLLAATALSPVAAFAKAKSPPVAAIATPVSDITDPKSLISPENPNAKPVPLEDLNAIRNSGEAVWTPDGKSLVFTTNLAGRNNLWKMTEGVMMPVQLSQSEDRQGSVSVSADGQTVYFTSDHAGHEIYDLYSLPIGGGAITNLTNTPDQTETSPILAPDGQSFALTVRKADGNITNISLFDLKTKTFRALTDEKDANHQWSGTAFSPDGKSLYAMRLTADYATSIAYVIDIATGAATPLIDTDPKDMTYITDASPDGKWLAFTTNMTTGQPHAGLYNLATKTTTWLKPTPWEQTSATFSRDGKQLVISNNADGRASLTLVDMANLTETPLNIAPGFTSLGSGVQNSFNPVTGKLLVYRDAGDSPNDYWTVDPTGAAPATRLTRLAIATLDPANLPKTQIVHYKSFDGTPISAIVTMPFNLKRDGTNPVIVFPHGGPTGQAQDYFNKYATAFASRGYIVIQPNFRGSTGYGLPFQKANIKDLGNGDLKDVIAGVDFLKSTGYVDPKKIGITGGSYGGYMTLIAMGKYPDTFAAGVELFGIINWYTMYANKEGGLHEYLANLLGDPVKDKAVYDAASPMTYAQNIKAPLLVQQGENDARVPKNQAEEVVARVKLNGGIVDAVYYANEGHGFSRKENQVDSLARMVAWMDKYVKGVK